MKTSQLYENDGLRTFALVMDDGDDPYQEIVDFGVTEEISGASLTGLGACRNVTLGYFDPEISDYRRRNFDEQLEVLSCVGDIATKDGAPALHAHVVLGRDDYSAVGGHLLAADVFPTMEVLVTETPAHLRKRVDAQTGLALISLRDSSSG